MISHILFAEFDDLKGKIIRHSYPQPVEDLDKENVKAETPAK